MAATIVAWIRATDDVDPVNEEIRAPLHFAANLNQI